MKSRFNRVCGGLVAALAANAVVLQAQIVAPPTVDIPVQTQRTGSTPTTAKDAPATARPDSDSELPDRGASDPRKLLNTPQVRVDCLMISSREENILPRLSRLRDPKQVAAAEQELLELVARKEAQLEGWPEITTHSGCRAVSESIAEQRYPIEFEMPRAKQPEASKSQEGKGRPVDEAVALARNVDGPAPTTFETRNVGATIEAEPVASPDYSFVTISLSPQIVRSEGYTDFPAGITAGGQKLTIPQPNFSTGKVSTTVTLKNGERRLIYVGKAGSDRGRMDVFILGATIIPPAVERK